jgi:Ca-activated chloride channel homolog
MKAVAWLALYTLLAIPAYSQERQPYTVSVDVDLVVLNVRVQDKNGQSVRGLAKADFEVREDGKRQDISLFIGQDSPATIGLVLDSSSSMNSTYADVKAAALRFIQTANAKDQIFVLHFNDRVHWALPDAQPFTDDIGVLEKALSRNVVGGRTALYDALTAALHHSGRGQWEKRALIVLADGGDNASGATLEQAFRLAQQSNVMLYTIGLFDPLAAETSKSALQKLAAATGGDAYFPTTIEELTPLWQEIARGIRSQYTIGYRPAVTKFDGKFHKVKVRVESPNATRLDVHTRPGYLARKAAVAER